MKKNIYNGSNDRNQGARDQEKLKRDVQSLDLQKIENTAKILLIIEDINATIELLMNEQVRSKCLFAEDNGQLAKARVDMPL